LHLKSRRIESKMFILSALCIPNAKQQTLQLRLIAMFSFLTEKSPCHMQSYFFINMSARCMKMQSFPPLLRVAITL